MSLDDYIMRARQAQVDHERRIDVQLPLIPFIPEIEYEWASDDEIREHADREEAQEWEDWFETNAD